MIKRKNPELLSSSLPDPRRYEKEKRLGDAVTFLTSASPTPKQPAEEKEEPAAAEDDGLK